VNLEAEVEPGIANQARCLRLVVFVPNIEAYSYGVAVPSSNRTNFPVKQIKYPEQKILAP
jgi:hypothetical protein